MCCVTKGYEGCFLTDYAALPRCFANRTVPSTGSGMLAWSPKGYTDVVPVHVLLTLLAPALRLIARATKLETPGPFFFRQRHHRLNNCVFKI